MWGNVSVTNLGLSIDNEPGRASLGLTLHCPVTPHGTPWTPCFLDTSYFVVIIPGML